MGSKGSLRDDVQSELPSGDACPSIGLNELVQGLCPRQSHLHPYQKAEIRRAGEHDSKGHDASDLRGRSSGLAGAMGLDKVTLSTGEELDRLAGAMGITRIRGEPDEHIRGRIFAVMNGYGNRVPFPDFEIYINTDYPELGRDVPPF